MGRGAEERPLDNNHSERSTPEAARQGRHGERKVSISRQWLGVAVDELVDDPYRSLAGALRRLGGYAKDTTPFSEFLWADFLRRRIDRKEIEDHLKRAVDKALELAKSRDADYLPGWCGLVDD